MIYKHNSHILAYMVYLLNKPLKTKERQNILDMKLNKCEAYRRNAEG